MIEIKSYPAKNGEAFLVKATDGSFTMLIDGGYGETFNEHFGPDLMQLAAKGGNLDFVVATHVDADHISGLVSFFRLNGRADVPAIIRVGGVLHNSLRSMVSPSGGNTKLRPDDAALLQEIRRRGYPSPPSHTSAEQEISARQGGSLAELLRSGGYCWNTGDGTRSVGSEGVSELSCSGARIHVLGPNRDRLDRLKKWWAAELRRFGFAGTTAELDDIFEFLCAHEASPRR